MSYHIIHEMLRKKGKTTQHNSPKAVIFQRTIFKEKAALIIITKSTISYSVQWLNKILLAIANYNMTISIVYTVPEALLVVANTRWLELVAEHITQL